MDDDQPKAASDLVSVYVPLERRSIRKRFRLWRAMRMLRKVGLAEPQWICRPK